jgi:hypothetical protein
MRGNTPPVFPEPALTVEKNQPKGWKVRTRKSRVVGEFFTDDE